MSKKIGDFVPPLEGAPQESKPKATPARRFVMPILGGLGVVIAAGIAGSLGREAARSAMNSLSAPSDEEVASALSDTVKRLNEGLPQAVDNATRIDRVSSGPGRKITYHYTLTGLTSTQVSARGLEAAMRSSVNSYFCTNGDMAVFREHDVDVVYKYRGMDGGSIGELLVSKNDCRTAPKRARQRLIPDARAPWGYCAEGTTYNAQTKFCEPASPF